MNHLDLFSGIGGFSLGLKKVFDIKHTYYSEIDKYAIDVYKNNFKNITYVKSVTDVRGGELPGIDIITFGSPCQDFSMAGKRKGMDGARSSLISEAIRLIEECRPSFFIWENVKGTFSSNSGADFWAIIQAFTNIGGYRLEWQLLNTKWFLPQNRERIYLVGYIGKGSGQQIFPITENNKQVDELQRQQANTCTLAARRRDGQGSYIIERELDAQEKGYEIANKTIVHDIPEIVTKRKYEINTDELRAFLRKHKTKSIKQISKEMNMPYSQVEHWFRNGDKWFSIPPAEIWYQLKDVLNITETKYDKAITTFIEMPGSYEKTNRVYDSEGIAPTLTKTSGDERIMIKTNNKKGYEIAKPGDTINYQNLPSKTRRGRVGKGIAQTLDAGGEQAVISANAVTMTNLKFGCSTMTNLSPSLTSAMGMGGGHTPIVNYIRRLTPKECERLQGFPDNWTKTGKELGEISDSQRYKMCGNAVTVDVVEAVAKNIKKVLPTKIN